MVRVSAIPYLNTVPFVYGLKQQAVREHIELSFDTPADAARKLQNKQCDLAIVPVAVLPMLPHAQIISDYCIGAKGPVASVLLCSRIPVELIREIALDKESMTSVRLVKILAQQYWKISPNYRPLDTKEPLDQIESAVLIGDKALVNQSEFPYVYDLAEHWIALTAKPFVFATWTANKALDVRFISLFNEALEYGVANIEAAVVSEVKDFPQPLALEYLKNNISYHLDAEKKEGLRLFWDYLKTINTD